MGPWGEPQQTITDRGRVESCFNCSQSDNRVGTEQGQVQCHGAEGLVPKSPQGAVGQGEGRTHPWASCLAQLQSRSSCSSSVPKQDWENSSTSGVSKPVQLCWCHSRAQRHLHPTPSLLPPSAWGQKPRVGGNGTKEMGARGWRGTAASYGDVRLSLLFLWQLLTGLNVVVLDEAIIILNMQASDIGHRGVLTVTPA